MNHVLRFTRVQNLVRPPVPRHRPSTTRRDRARRSTTLGTWLRVWLHGAGHGTPGLSRVGETPPAQPMLITAAHGGRPYH
jgi:hypothetical protein